MAFFGRLPWTSTSTCSFCLAQFSVSQRSLTSTSSARALTRLTHLRTHPRWAVGSCGPWSALSCGRSCSSVVSTPLWYWPNANAQRLRKTTESLRCVSRVIQDRCTESSNTRNFGMCGIAGWQSLRKKWDLNVWKIHASPLSSQYHFIGWLRRGYWIWHLHNWQIQGHIRKKWVLQCKCKQCSGHPLRKKAIGRNAIYAWIIFKTSLCEIR